MPTEKLSLVYNWIEPPWTSSPARSSRRSGAASEDFVLMYAGNHGAAQALSCARCFHPHA